MSPFDSAGSVLLLTAPVLVVLGIAGFAALRSRRRARAIRAPPPLPPAPEPPQEAPDGPVAIEGDVRLSGRVAFPHSLTVRGVLTLSPDARVTGDVKAEGGVVLEAGARVAGRIEGRGHLRMGAGARSGPVEVAGNAYVTPSARVEGKLACERIFFVPPAEKPRAEEPSVALAPTST